VYYGHSNSLPFIYPLGASIADLYTYGWMVGGMHFSIYCYCYCYMVQDLA